MLGQLYTASYIKKKCSELAMIARTEMTQELMFLLRYRKDIL